MWGLMKLPGRKSGIFYLLTLIISIKYCVPSGPCERYRCKWTSSVSSCHFCDKLFATMRAYQPVLMLVIASIKFCWYTNEIICMYIMSFCVLPSVTRRSGTPHDVQHLLYSQDGAISAHTCTPTPTPTSWPPKHFCFCECDSDTIFSPKLRNIYEHREFSYACSINHPCGQLGLAVFCLFFHLGIIAWLSPKQILQPIRQRRIQGKKYQGSLADSEVQTKHLNTPTLIWLLITVPPSKWLLELEKKIKQPSDNRATGKGIEILGLQIPSLNNSDQRHIKKIKKWDRMTIILEGLSAGNW